MKENIIFSVFCLLMLFACTDKKASQSIDNQLDAKEIEEVKALENENAELENLDIEIEQKAKELEELLEEIDK